MLTGDSTISYSDNSLYAVPVEPLAEDIGARLKAVRLSTGFSLREIAERALGAHATANQLRDFSNYLQRIERDGGNPSLQQFQAWAVGMRFPSVSALLIAIERADPADATRNTLLIPSRIAHNPPSLVGLREDSNASPLSPPPSITDLERIAVGAAETIIAAIQALGARLEKRGITHPPARSKASDRRGSARKRIRKSA